MSDKEFNTEHENGGVDKKRRSLTKIGLTTPVIASLLSRPAFATQCSGSALASGNLSNPVNLSTCGACSPAQWTKATQAELSSIPIVLTASIDTIFSIPQFTPKDEDIRPILTGTIRDALIGNITIDHTFTAGNKDATDAAIVNLKAAFIEFITAYLNASHIATKINFLDSKTDVVNKVNSALSVTESSSNDKNFELNMATINDLKGTYSTANSSNSCAINRNP